MDLEVTFIKKIAKIIQIETLMREKIGIRGLKIKTQNMPTFRRQRNKNPEDLP